MNNMRLRKIDDDGNILEDFIPVGFINEHNNNNDIFVSETLINRSIKESFHINNNNDQDVVVFSIGKDYEYCDHETNEDVKHFVMDTIRKNKELVSKIILNGDEDDE